MRSILIGLFVLALAAPSFAQNHADVVQQVAAEGAPEKTLEGALQFTLRVIARLNVLYPAERAGLAEKTAGENIVPYNGTRVSASRVCYPNNHLFKILTDVPTSNGPEWVEDGYMDGIGYNKGYLAVGAPPVVTPPPPPPPALDLSGVPAQLAELAAKIDTLTAADTDAHHAIHQNVTDLRNDIGSWKKDLGVFLAKYVLPELGTFAAAWKLAGK